MEILFAEIEAHWGFLLIIAFLLGMGTPYPGKGKREGWSATLEHLEMLAPLLEQMARLLKHSKSLDRTADPDETSEDTESGSP